MCQLVNGRQFWQQALHGQKLTYLLLIIAIIAFVLSEVPANILNDVLSKSVKARGGASLFMAAILQATYGPLTREMVIMFGAFAQVAFRLGMGFLAITLFNVARLKFLRLPPKSRRKTLLLGVLWFCNVALFTVSVTTTSIATSVFVMYAASIISSLWLGILLQGERLTPLKLVAVGVALTGLVIYMDGASLHVGAWAALGAGVLDGTCNIIRKRLRHVEGYTLLQYQSAICALAALPVALLAPEQSIHHVSIWALAAGAIYGVLSLGRNKLLHYGIHHFDAHAGAIILASQLFFATLFGVVFYHEIPSPMQLLGGSLIFGAAVLCVLRLSTIKRAMAKLRPARSATLL